MYVQVVARLAFTIKMQRQDGAEYFHGLSLRYVFKLQRQRG